MHRYHSIICLCILVTVITGCGNRSAARHTRRAIQHFKFGYMDKHGSLVVKPLFDEACPFSEGMAAVRIGQKWGYIDKHGRLVVKPRYTAASEFHEGLARVYKTMSAEHPEGPPESSRDYMDTTFIDRSGRKVFSLHALCTDFSGGLAAFGVGPCPSEYKWGYVSKAGKVVVKSQMGSSDSVSEGLVFFTKTDGSGESGYMDASGRVVFRTPWTIGGPFHEGLASFSNDACKTGYINKSGRVVIRLRFDDGGDFHCGLAYQYDNSTSCYSYIDRHGKVRVKPRFSNFYDVIDFSDGLARFQDRKTLKWGFIDAEGNIRIKAQYTDANDFHEGLALVAVGSKSEYIDQRGHIRISRAAWKGEGIKDNHLNFSEGLVPWPVRQ